MRRRDLQRSGTELDLDGLVGDHRDPALGERDTCPLADEVTEPLVLRVHGHRDVGEDGLGPHRRYPHGAAALELVGQLVELALPLLTVNLEVGQNGLAERVPVDDPLLAVDLALLVELDELQPHGRRQSRVHREAQPVPGGADPQPLQLGDDDAAVALLPLPDTLHEGLAAEVVARGALGLECPLDHDLRRDARVVAAGLEQRLVAAHALVADERVDDRVVEGVSKVERPGDVGRRDHDREGRLVALGVRRERPLAPALSPPGLDLCRLVARG